MHELAVATASYTSFGLDATIASDGAEGAFTVGVASCLFEVAAGTGDWDILLVCCAAPLFWLAADASAPPHLLVRANDTISDLVRLARARACSSSSRSFPRGARHEQVVGPAAVAEVAAGRIMVSLDVGVEAAFPAIGVAARRGAYDPHVARRLVRAHRSALAHVDAEQELVAGVLERRLGFTTSDARDAAPLLASRFGVMPLAEARSWAVAGSRLLGLDASAVQTAFVPSFETDASWS